MALGQPGKIIGLRRNWYTKPNLAPVAGVGLTLFIGLAAFGLVLVPGFSTLGTLTSAMFLGVAWRSLVGLPPSLSGGVQFSAKKLLRWAIILIGVRLNFGLLFSSGLQILLLDMLLIIFGLLFIPWLGKKFGLPPQLAFLIALGQSICGASAIGAAATLHPATKDDDMTLAIALCGVVGTLGVVLFLLVSNLGLLSGQFLALLAGSTLHEIGQVVALGPAAAAGAADYALIVKLTRVALLAPVLISLTLLRPYLALAPKRVGSYKFSWRQVPMPWFVLGFLAIGGANSAGLFSPTAAGLILNAANLLFVMAMAGMGLLVDLKAIRHYGLRALAVASLSFVIFLAVSFSLALLFGY